MSTVTQVPIIEQVCVRTEPRIVGYRDAGDAQLAAEEAFSSGVPVTGVDPTQYDGLFVRGTVQVSDIFAPPVVPEPVDAVPLAPAAYFLLAGLGLWFAFTRRAG